MERYPNLFESETEKINNPKEIKYLLAELLKDSEVVESENKFNSTIKAIHGLSKGVSRNRHLINHFKGVQSTPKTASNLNKLLGNASKYALSMVPEEVDLVQRLASYPSFQEVLRRESGKSNLLFIGKDSENLLESFITKDLYKNLKDPKFEDALVLQIQGSSSIKIAKFVKHTKTLVLVKTSQKLGFALLAHSNLNSRTLIAKRLYNHFVSLSKQAKGSKFLVVMIQEMGVRVKRQQIMDVIKDSLKSMMLHKHSHSVILAIMEAFNMEDWEPIAYLALLNLKSLLKSPFGHKILVKLVLLTKNKRDQQRFLNKITTNSKMVFRCEFAEPVLSAIITSWKEEGLERMVNSICDEMFCLIKIEKGCRLVEKAIENSPEVHF